MIASAFVLQGGWRIRGALPAVAAVIGVMKSTTPNRISSLTAMRRAACEVGRGSVRRDPQLGETALLVQRRRGDHGRARLLAILGAEAETLSGEAARLGPTAPARSFSGTWRVASHAAPGRLGALQLIDETGEPYRWPAVPRGAPAVKKRRPARPAPAFLDSFARVSSCVSAFFRQARRPLLAQRDAFGDFRAPPEPGKACPSASSPTSAQKRRAGITRRIARHLLSSAPIQPRHAPVREGSTWRVSSVAERRR